VLEGIFFFCHPLRLESASNRFFALPTYCLQAAALRVAMAQALWVVGAGTEEVNGKYDRIEDLNGKPRYRRKVGCVSE
jgi:hypothetical protein